MSNFNTAAPCTDQMKGVNLGWLDIKEYAQDAINLLQNHGDVFKDMIVTGFKMAQAIGGHDYGTILTCLQQEKLDVEAAIAAIKTEFHLE